MDSKLPLNARKCMKIVKKVLIQQFFWNFGATLIPHSVKYNPVKLYTSEKPIKRPLYSTKRISKILPWEKLTDNSKWRQNGYFSPKLAVPWVRVIQFWQIIPFFATANQAQSNGWTDLEIWRHQKFESVRVPFWASAISRKTP